jgi:hypothetical protein
MAKLTPDQIRSYAANAGFKGDDLNIAVQVALAESGGDPGAHNATPPDDSYGLWQINMLGAMGPDRRAKFGIKDNRQLFDPATNAHAAFMIWQQQGWQKGWTTVANGKYQSKSILDKIATVFRYTALGRGLHSTANAPAAAGDAVSGAVASVKSSILSVTDGINNFGKNIVTAGEAMAGVLVGILLLGVAVTLMVVNSKGVKGTVGAVAKVVK